MRYALVVSTWTPTRHRVGGFIVYKSGGVLLRSVDVLLDQAPVGIAEAVRRSKTAKTMIRFAIGLR